MVTIFELTQRILNNKKKRGWNTTDLNMEFCYLNGEVTEAYAATYLNSTEELAFELADICIFLLGIAGIAKIDLRDILIYKLLSMNKNVSKDRKYIDTYFLNLYISISKSFEVYSKKLPNLSECLAEIFANVYVISLVYEIDLSNYIEKKVEINEKREYEKINGVDIKKEDAEAYKEQIESKN